MAAGGEPGARSGIQARKKSSLLAQEVVNEIVANAMVPGDRLPPEADMCDKYGVGRSTIREALRVLESQDEYFPYYRKYHAFWRMYGVGLPDDVLRKVYCENAARIVPGIEMEQCR